MRPAVKAARHYSKITGAVINKSTVRLLTENKVQNREYLILEFAFFSLIVKLNCREKFVLHGISNSSDK